ncbi:hypothetical protein AOY20_09195 [Acinetobacter equi]|uniref:Uncharacterized protein n=1 Tax=Acinetobacter equi TaxID=1324350 RepID=A0A0N9W207_9GAMM|nr:hypothetical protein [Acinetobacter equi]ALH95692.1 hypothetical protein AOY20_09195 [Acinetobacter equi]
MADFQFHLGNFNSHWENKPPLTENQKHRRFAMWLLQEFEKAERSVKARTFGKQNNFQDKPKSALQATKDLWAQERFERQQQAQASQIIDVNSQVLIRGGYEHF